VLQGRLQDAAHELEAAEDLLRSGGTPRIRAGVLARAIELDLAAGRFSAAIHRADSLIELVNARELDERAAEAWTLRALVQHRLDPTGDDEALQRARGMNRPSVPESWPVGVMLARMLADRGQLDLARAALPSADALPGDLIEDAPAQVAALRARCLAVDRRDRAIDLARWCLVREPARLVLRHVDVCLDVGHALVEAGDRSLARQAAKHGLRLLTGPGSDALRVDLLALFHAADPDPRVREALAQVTDRVLRAQPPALRKVLQTQAKWNPGR
jgi:tetratricopeptide (TPR) repeat protein